MSIIIKNIDCIEGLKDIEPESIDVVVTSPPYNIGTAYKHYKDNLQLSAYQLWCRSWLNALYKVLKPDGSLFLNLGSKPTEPLIPYKVLGVAIDSNYHLQNTIHWIKSITVKGNTSGHYKPINSPRFVNDCHEYIFHLTKTGKVTLDRLSIGVPYADTSNVDRWGSKSNLHCRGNNWYIPYSTIQSRKDQRPHPATFPMELPLMCIKLHGVNSDMTVLDPFNGIGNTGLACKELNINYIGFEIDNDYYKESEMRLNG